MADLQELLPPSHAAQMHPRDRLLLAAFNWAGNMGGPLAVGCYIAWAIDQMPLRLAAPGMVVGLVAMTGATIYAFQKRAPTKRSYFWPMTFGAIALTWAVLGWQTWMWFHPSAQAVQGYTQAQLDDAKAKAKQDQLDQDKKDAVQQTADAVAKATASLRAQTTPSQSDTPVSVEKLPTSLQLNFKGNDIEEISSRNVIWTKIIGYRQSKGLIPQSYPGWTIVIVFKKPIAFKYIHYDDHAVGLPTPEEDSSDSHYAVIDLNWFIYNGLLDISLSNERSK
jgi:hypothetical protein